LKKLIPLIVLILIGISGVVAYHFMKERPIPPAGIQKNSFNPRSNERQVTFLSDIYEIDSIYKSMKGPSSKEEILLIDSKEPELIWITGYSAVMVRPDGETPMSQEFMCHSNLDFDSKTHNYLFQSRTNPLRDRLFTLSQGQDDVRFPEGFGIPMLSPETLSLTTQVLNLNHENADLKTRHKVTISYIRDSELKSPIKPLIQLAANGMKRLDEHDDGYFGVMEPDKEIHGSGCLLGENASSHVQRDEYYRKFTGHWVVKPGKEVNHTLVTDFLRIPYDTTVHYIAIHLHPFAESLELRDLTTGETVFRSKARNSENRIGLDYVDYFSATEGIPVYKGHEYQLISIYNNTTDSDQDSMAVIYMYMLDKDYRRPNESVAEILNFKPASKNSISEK